MPCSPELAVAMDWGGTWARASVIDRQGQVIWSSRATNPPDGSREELLANAGKLLREALNRGSDRGVAGIGVAVAGPVDAETGTLYDPPNLPALDGVSLKATWESTLGIPVFVGNDANLAALGEYHYGAGLETRRLGNPPRTLVYVTISTGIGGGVIDRGQMFLGAHGLAAEIGHMVIDGRPQALHCQCGNYGCLEALASGTAIASMARQRLTGGGSPDSILASRDPGPITSEDVFEAASQGDRLAKEILDDVVSALAIGLTNILHLYNPDLVVLGGGVTSGLVQLDLLSKINQLMLEKAMSKRHQDFRLAASALGDEVGMIGAASLVWSAMEASG